MLQAKLFKFKAVFAKVRLNSHWQADVFVCWFEQRRLPMERRIATVECKTIFACGCCIHKWCLLMASKFCSQSAAVLDYLTLKTYKNGRPDQGQNTHGTIGNEISAIKNLYRQKNMAVDTALELEISRFSKGWFASTFDQNRTVATSKRFIFLSFFFILHRVQEGCCCKKAIRWDEKRRRQATRLLWAADIPFSYHHLFIAIAFIWPSTGCLCSCLHAAFMVHWLSLKLHRRHFTADIFLSNVSLEWCIGHHTWKIKRFAHS